ncbi:MAG: single-stranded DNA-binding protein [Bacteroidales bacterium]|nr:single-stranded DNA-binding protein [Bacteroidales bacterium]
MNKIYLIGNLIKDPALKSVPSGQSVCEFTIAVNRNRWKTDEVTSDLFRISAWRGLGETCARYLEKGRKVAVIGELKATTFVGKDGIMKVSLDVNADEVEFLSSKNDRRKEDSEDKPHPAQEGFTDISSDEIPF